MYSRETAIEISELKSLDSCCNKRPKPQYQNTEESNDRCRSHFKTMLYESTWNLDE